MLHHLPPPQPSRPRQPSVRPAWDLAASVTTKRIVLTADTLPSP